MNLEQYKQPLKDFMSRHNIKIDIDNPKTIQDKINWLKIYDTTQLKSDCADKYKIHEYSKKVIGRDICIPIIATYKSTKDINWETLPNEFVIKCNHGSGMNIIVKDKKTANKGDIYKKLEGWLLKDFSFQNGYEMQYHFIERCIIVEEYKHDEKQENSLFDYKFWCFNGEPKFYTINDGHGHGGIVHYDMRHQIMDLERTDHPIHKDTKHEQPLNFSKMVEYAKKLSKEFCFVRVDFYEVNGELFLGEMTFTPGSGIFKYKDSACGLMVGNMLELPKIEQKKKKICIVHYNTPKLTECLVRSINKCMTDTLIYLFDNSDKNKYTYITDNVKVIDNTKGQIINFDEWLKKYPDRNKNQATVNRWGSAKHCYTIQKCIEIIDDDFVLLDSDVLIKKDFSSLYDKSKIFVGGKELLNHTYRVLPYILYLNVEKMKQMNVKFFDEKRMFGLYDRNAIKAFYDTGASFYEDTIKIDHNFINVSNFIEHYKAGSWVEDARQKHNYKQVSDTDWLNRYEKLWHTSHKVIYTCITGGYDTLLTPKVFDNDYDYICFTDNMSIPSNGWTLKKIPEELNGLSNVKKQRIIKICPHKYLKEYDMSVWVDASVKLTSSVSSYVNDKCKKENGNVFIPQHPNRSCIYDEASVCVKYKKDTSDNINPQIERYKKEGFPKKYGLVQSNIVIRYHNEADCVKLMDMWAEELKKGSHRDQLSFDYARWKNQDAKFVFLDKTTCKRTPFMWGSHKPQKLTNAKASVHIPSEVVRVKTSTNQNALNSENPKNTAMANYVRKQRAAIRNIRTFTSEY